MTEGKQEVISPEQAKEIQRYEYEVRNYRAVRTVQKRGGVYAVSIAAPLWFVSYLASAETGPINQGAWFSFLAVCAFVAALIASLVAIGLYGVVTLTGRPVKHFDTDGDSDI